MITEKPPTTEFLEIEGMTDYETTKLRILCNTGAAKTYISKKLCKLKGEDCKPCKKSI